MPCEPRQGIWPAAEIASAVGGVLRRTDPRAFGSFVPLATSSRVSENAEAVQALRIGNLLAGLGPEVLSELVSPHGLDAEFQRVIVAEEGVAIEPGDLVVLPPDVTETHGAGIGNQVNWIRKASAAGGAAVVAKPSGSAHANELVTAAQNAGIAVLGIGTSIPWFQAMAQISASVEAFGLAGSESADGFLQDLFALAETTSIAAGGAVAIMDSYGQIVAYSSQPNQPIDSVRTDGILGRKVPPEFLRSHVEARHWKAGEAKRMESPGTLPRLAVPVRAADMFLGSVWVIIPSAATVPDLEAILAAAARTAAVHLLRYASVSSSSAWRASEAVVRARLLGRPSTHPTTAAEQSPCLVLAVIPAAGDPVEDTALRERLAALTFLVVSAWPQAGCAVLEDVVYALLPLAGHRTAQDARDAAGTIVRRSRESLNLAVAVGLSSETADIPDARRECLETALWMVNNGGGVGSYEEIRIRETLARVAALLAEGRISMPSINAVRSHDERHDTEFGRTILAYLENGLNVAAAASALHLHPNTLRYRLRRVAELFQLTLEDPDERLGAWMFLRLGAPSGDANHVEGRSSLS